MDDLSIDFFKKQWKNKNTERATSTWVKKYVSWAADNSLERDMERMDPVGLNKTLELYFSQIKKADGGQYELNSLCVMQAALDRYLNEKKYGYSILRDTLL